MLIIKDWLLQTESFYNLIILFNRYKIQYLNLEKALPLEAIYFVLKIENFDELQLP